MVLACWKFFFFIGFYSKRPRLLCNNLFYRRCLLLITLPACAHMIDQVRFQKLLNLKLLFTAIPVAVTEENLVHDLIFVLHLICVIQLIFFTLIFWKLYTCIDPCVVYVLHLNTSTFSFSVLI
jgi:hypothetical protein